jgi:hypothetical protein
VPRGALAPRNTITQAPGPGFAQKGDTRVVPTSVAEETALAWQPSAAFSRRCAGPFTTRGLRAMTDQPADILRRKAPQACEC